MLYFKYSKIFVNNPYFLLIYIFVLYILVHISYIEFTTKANQHSDIPLSTFITYQLESFICHLNNISVVVYMPQSVASSKRGHHGIPHVHVHLHLYHYLFFPIPRNQSSYRRTNSKIRKKTQNFPKTKISEIVFVFVYALTGL